MSKKRFKQYLMLLTVIGLVAVAAGGGSGTFASFTAETTNAGNTFATGTLVLSNTVNAGTACVSANGGVDTNVNTGCDKVFNVSVKKPGDTYLADQIDLTNTGSLDPSALKFTAGTCADGNAVGETVHGTGSLCSNLDVYIQEYSDSGFTTPSHCWYGGGTATLCAFDDTKTLGTISGVSPITLTGGLAHTTHRYFKIGLELPLAAGNNVQGLSATADLTWHIDQ